MNIIVFKRTGRKFFEAQWKDPVTGKKKTRSTKKTTRRDAERFAALLEKELLSPAKKVDRIKWVDFRRRYEDEALLGKSEKTVGKDKSTLNKIEDLLNPEYLDNISASEIGKMKKALYKEGLEPFTIKSHLSITGKFLRWAIRQKLLLDMPTIDMPKKVTGRRGRAITPEEFDRVLGKVETVVGKKAAESWKLLLNGFWWGGLRLEEAMRLHWDENSGFYPDFSGKRPMFNISGHAEKGRKDRVLPMAPEFADLIRDLPREGFVFNPQRRMAPYHLRISADHVGKVISEIGEKAKVKVSEIKGKAKFASAHDFRRSFGSRWAMRVLPPVLMELMRHDQISTTMVFYVGRNAQVAAEAAWDAMLPSTDTFANTDKKEEKSA